MLLRILLVLAIISGNANATSDNIPKWLSDDMAKRKAEGHIDYIREGEYEGKMVYLIQRPELKGDIDYYILVGADQRIICTLGGPQVRVTRGKCDLVRIKYTREIQAMQNPQNWVPY